MLSSQCVEEILGNLANNLESQFSHSMKIDIQKFPVKRNIHHGNIEFGPLLMESKSLEGSCFFFFDENQTTSLFPPTYLNGREVVDMFEHLVVVDVGLRQLRLEQLQHGVQVLARGDNQLPQQFHQILPVKVSDAVLPRLNPNLNLFLFWSPFLFPLLLLPLKLRDLLDQ